MRQPLVGSCAILHSYGSLAVISYPAYFSILLSEHLGAMFYAFSMSYRGMISTMFSSLL